MHGSKQLPGSGRKAFFINLEYRLIEFIQERNKLGLRVKDKYITAKMKALRDAEIERLSMSEEDDDKKNLDKLKHFEASPMWLFRFKGRHNLVSRRETGCRSLPTNFRELATTFIEEVQKLIREKKIQPARIVNLDQVPRYCELNNGSTITTKGTRDVHLKKTSTAHKRFTWTPVVNAGGDVVLCHLLFSKLKNKPKVHEKCVVDVNGTGMFSTEIIETFIENLLPKVQSPFREPCLIILDSYGAHLKYLNTDDRLTKYERRNVFFKVIPPKLTGLLQPLDVCLNRSFQKSFDDAYTEFLEKAMKDGTNLTPQGNYKMPSYLQMSEWCVNWAHSRTKEQVCFQICNVVCVSVYKRVH